MKESKNVRKNLLTVLAVLCALALGIAVGALLLQAAASSVPLTFSSSLSPTFSTRTVRFREIVGVTGVLSGLSMVSSGVSTSVMGGFSPVMASLIWSPKISHTTSAASRITAKSIAGAVRVYRIYAPRLKYPSQPTVQTNPLVMPKFVFSAPHQRMAAAASRQVSTTTAVPPRPAASSRRSTDSNAAKSV